jgi:hypothetical protein
MAKNKKIPKRVTSNEKVRKAASDFFEEAWKARTELNPNILYEALKNMDYIVKNGISFKQDQVLRRKLISLIQICIENLGTIVGHEIDVENIIWNVAINMKGPNYKEAAKEFVLSIDSNIEEEFIFISANNVINFEDGIKELQIGPVKAIDTRELLNLVDPKAEKKWLIQVGKNIGTEIAVFPDREDENKREYGWITTLPAESWHVLVKASKSNVQEHALWLINTALTILRLSYPVKHNTPLFPYINEKEAHPFDPSIITDNNIIIDKSTSNIQFGGYSLPRRYTITNEILDHLQSIDFDKRADLIFSSNEDKLAARIAHGIGWITRGRHTADRSERFLFFYTAIEALLSFNPEAVTQTIARYASTLLDDDIEKRVTIAKIITEAYAIRSKLVHGGHRYVSYYDAYNAQKIAEDIYYSVLENIDLNITTQQFESDLKKASYGLQWPPKD